jgi:hypothetical protein
LAATQAQPSAIQWVHHQLLKHLQILSSCTGNTSSLGPWPNAKVPPPYQPIPTGEPACSKVGREDGDSSEGGRE